MDTAPSASRPSLRFDRGPWPWGGRSYVMAILNATPDSFSGDGLLALGGVAEALAAAEAAIEGGADILDLGGESTRPGAAPIDAATELGRVLPILRALRRAHPRLPISVDTSKAEVAEAALAEGADWINDVWGLRADPRLAAVVAAAGAPVVLMHNRSTPAQVALRDRVGGFYREVHYDDLIAELRQALLGSVAIARDAGIAEDRIVLDPGLGFGKTPAQNLELLDRLAELRDLGFPLLVGSSRKSFIGLTLDLPPGERLEGTAATVAVAITRGADVLRVHDVKVMTRVARMTDAIVRRPGLRPAPSPR